MSSFQWPASPSGIGPVKVFFAVDMSVSQTSTLLDISKASRVAVNLTWFGFSGAGNIQIILSPDGNFFTNYGSPINVTVGDGSALVDLQTGAFYMYVIYTPTASSSGVLVTYMSGKGA